MSSLHSLLRKKGRIRVPLSRKDTTEAQERMCKIHDMLLALAQRPECILVNANSVADDLIETEQWRIKVEDLHKIPCVMPPFPVMWIEFRIDAGQFAAQVIRDPADDNPRVSVHTWQESDGFVGGPIFKASFLLDESGSIDQDSFRPNVMARITGNNLTFAWLSLGCALHALSRMNCRNVELRPIREGKLRPHPPNIVVPASVWHEIVITSVPKIRSTGKDIFPHEDEREIRSHWIRGHYADYRKGSGLFGNPKLKGLFWIPEHRRGNEELGQVIPEYTVQ